MSKIKLCREAKESCVYNPIVIWFLSKCRNPQTGIIDQWAKDIINTMDSYAEIMPPGSSIAIFVCAGLPRGRRRSKNIIILDHERRLHLKGQHLKGTPKMIKARQRESTELYKARFKKRKREKKPNSKIRLVGMHKLFDS